jgi:hypothetical protein
VFQKQEDEKEKQPKAVTSSVTSSVRNHQQRLENILRNTVVEIRVRTHSVHRGLPVFTHTVRTHLYLKRITGIHTHSVHTPLFEEDYRYSHTQYSHTSI